MQWDAGEVCQDRDKSLTHRNSSHFPTGSQNWNSYVPLPLGD